MRGAGGLLIYLNLLTFGFLVYLKIYVMNPKIG
jgi:hypothetical protein